MRQGPAAFFFRPTQLVKTWALAVLAAIELQRQRIHSLQGRHFPMAVTGHLQSAPTDLAGRLQQVERPLLRGRRPRSFSWHSSSPAQSHFSSSLSPPYQVCYPRKKELSSTPVPVLTPLAEQTEQDNERVPARGDDKQFTIEQEAEFIRRYKALGSIKEVLSQMHLGYGRYQRCASRVVKERGLRRA